MIQKYFSNGNLHLKKCKNENEEITFSNIYLFSDSICDLITVSNLYYISNYAAAMIYSYSGGFKYYELTSFDLLKLNEGKTIILKPLIDSEIEMYISEGVIYD